MHRASPPPDRPLFAALTRRLRGGVWLAMVAGVALAVGDVLVHDDDPHRSAFAGTTLALGFGLGAAAAACAVGLRVARAANALRAAPSARTVLAEGAVLLTAAILLPAAGVAIGQLVTLATGTSWVQPFHDAHCCSGHLRAAALLRVGFSIWLLIPWAWAIGAALAPLRGGWLLAAPALAMAAFAATPLHAAAPRLPLEWLPQAWAWWTPLGGGAAAVALRCLARAGSPC